MLEPTVQVPVSLIERIASELEVDSRIRSAGDLRAFLSQPTPTAEPVRTLTEAQVRVVGAAIEGLAIHAETCGHRRADRECPYCDDQATVKAARAALGRAVWGPGEADPADSRWKPPVLPDTAPPSPEDMPPGTTFEYSEEWTVVDSPALGLLAKNGRSTRKIAEFDPSRLAPRPRRASPSIADMVPGTKLWCELGRVTVERDASGRWGLRTFTGYLYDPADIEPSTIRDVRPPEVTS